MNDIKKVIFNLVSFMVIFSTVAFAETPGTEKDQSAAVKEYVRLMERFGENKGVTSYPDYYAGAYLGESGELVILVTDMENAQSVLTNVDASLKYAFYSLNELININDTIYSYVENHTDEALVTKISGFGIDEKENKVIVSLTELSDELKQTFENEVMKSDAIIFEKRERMNTASSNLGSQIYYKSGSLTTYNYSMGFRAQRIINGIPHNGFVTSGHNMQDNVIIYDANGNRVGVVKGVMYNALTDASFVYADSQTISSTTTSGCDSSGHNSYKFRKSICILQSAEYC